MTVQTSPGIRGAAVSARSSRPRRLRRVAAGVVAATIALTLSACSTDLHPGNAAVVGGTAIPQSKVDDLLSAGCAYEAAMGKTDRQTYPVLSRATLRTNFLNVLIRNQLARQAAAEIGGLHVSQNQVDSFASGNTVPSSLPEPEKSTIKDFFHTSAETQLLVALIGAHLKDQSVTDASNVQQADLQAGQKYLNTYTEKADVSVNPSYGTWNGKSIDAGTGSLSVLATTPSAASSVPGQSPNPAETLPPDQQCG